MTGVPISIVQPPPSSSAASNGCQSPSCLTLFHQHPCLHNSSEKRTPSPIQESTSCAKLKHESHRLANPLALASHNQTVSTITGVSHHHHSCSGTLPSRMYHSSRQQGRSLTSQSNLSCSITDLSANALTTQEKEMRMSRSLEDLPKDIREHILKCKCSCDHLGYGNCSVSLWDFFNVY